MIGNTTRRTAWAALALVGCVAVACGDDTGTGGTPGSISLSGGDVTAGNLVTTGGARGNGGAVNVTSTGSMALAATTASSSWCSPPDTLRA